MSDIDSSSVSIRILEKDYTVACPPGEESALLASADLLNRKIKDIRDRGSIIGSERIAVMAALNLAHEFLSAEQNTVQYTTMDQRIAGLKEKIDTALNQIEIT